MWLKQMMRRWLMIDEPEKEPDPDDYFSMTMLGLSRFFSRLDPMVMAGVTFHIHAGGIMVNAYIPESQLANLLVRGEFD